MVKISRIRIRLGGLIIAFGGFDDQTVTNGLGGYLDADHFSINQGPDFLDIGLEFAFGDAGDLAADPTEVFGLTTAGDAMAGSRSFACKKTFS